MGVVDVVVAGCVTVTVTGAGGDAVQAAVASTHIVADHKTLRIRCLTAGTLPITGALGDRFDVVALRWSTSRWAESRTPARRAPPSPRLPRHGRRPVTIARDRCTDATRRITESLERWTTSTPIPGIRIALRDVDVMTARLDGA
ncbi:hypothetical protein [Saccharothrix australiensis]|uniref:hypothetical protein n=1 Tax=Saccharothrix australiensis TaxID=2072 RepID=UPI0011C4A268|nr:hypothetical protein [Saccharothrix australiensis]